MKLYRFVVSDNFTTKYLRIINPAILNQWRRVLRLRIGEKVILINNQAQEALARIINLTDNFAEAEIIEAKDNQNESKRDILLYCSILKKENFELAVQKATEIGVKEFVPIIAARTVKLNFRRERLEKIIQEAVEQSCRGVIPLLNNPVKFNEVMQFAKSNDLNLFFEPNAESFRKNIIKKEMKKIGVFIGPEGGWTEDEIAEAEHNGFKIVNLSNFILKAETAAIIASYLAVN